MMIHSGRELLFWMQNFDLFFICKDCPHTKLEQAKFDAFRAVEDSPVLKNIIERSEDDQLCDWYDLGVEFDEFGALVERLRRFYASDAANQEENKSPNLKSLMAKLDTDKTPRVKQLKTQQPTTVKSNTVPKYAHIFPDSVKPKIGPLELDKLERNIKNMDIFNLLATQNICAVVGDMAPEVVFTKKYVSLDEVNKSILPGYNISGDKWLFQRLTESFDYKLMQALVEYESFPANVLSININVSTVSTKAFDEFIAKQKTMSEHPIILEFTLFDIMSDLTAYYRAQQKIARLGCKTCICKMDIQTIAILDRALINVDFLKIRWNKNYLEVLTPSDRERIKAAVKEHGKMRVVLSDCDSKLAVKFGHAFGIVLYQGFEIDKLQGLK